MWLRNYSTFIWMKELLELIGMEAGFQPGLSDSKPTLSVAISSLSLTKALTTIEAKAIENFPKFRLLNKKQSVCYNTPILQGLDLILIPTVTLGRLVDSSKILCPIPAEKPKQ